MIIKSKDLETKEIEIQGFRKILKNPKHPDYKELRIYIQKGWIPIDPEDDERELQKAKRKKQLAKENKERRPSYEIMEKTIKKLDNKKLLEDFEQLKSIKNNYSEVVKWYNREVKNIKKEVKATLQKTEKVVKNEGK